MKKKLRKSEIRELNEELEKTYGLNEFFDKKETVEKRKNIILKEDTPLFFYHEETIVPTLRQCQINCPLKKVTVDMGAVKFVTGGADIMRPGITAVDEFKKGEFVAVIDETNKKPLAIAKALYSGEDIIRMKTGKVLENIHYVGDEIWTTGTGAQASRQ
ncbi:MAG: PUA domain-containing protein [Candidatus Nanoarchaeia archaeon]